MWRASVCSERPRWQAVLAFLLALGGGAASQAGEVQLDGPRGGWRDAGLLDDEDRPQVAYPYNLIDRGAQKGRTLIRGRLQAMQGERRPHTLVVNGNPMPLYTGKDGEFVRPYAFGAGSNSIEVRSPDGRPTRRVQFYETRGNGPRAAMRLIASWDDKQAEVDLHVVTPDGQHAYWGSPVLQGGGGLDVDSVDGAGPEMFSLAAPVKGTYHFYVNYWGNFGDAGYHFDETTRQRPVITVRLTLVSHENTAREKRETVVVPLRRIGDLTWVKSVAW
ncbi:YfaP family protein [Eleftheria terrae]|uniref:YfaP family protein n=1 Tax=Eleftheria terrae TaxID=1597781 RepID=UPI003F4DE23B